MSRRRYFRGMGRLAGMGRSYPAQVRVELLGGRLTADMPAGAVAAPVASQPAAGGVGGAGGSGAPEPLEIESRVVLDAGGERLVILAQEMFQHCEGGFRRSVKGMVGRWRRRGGPAVTAVTVPSRAAGMEVVVALHGSLEASGPAVPVADAFVRHPDTTVQRLSFLMSPEAIHDVEGCRLLTQEVLRTLAPGPRRLAWREGERVLPGPGAVGTPGALRVTVPAGWAVALQRGPDFVVHRLDRLMPFDGPFCSFGVYVGAHPWPLREPIDAEPMGRMFGRAVRWRVTREQRPRLAPVEHREVLVRLPGSEHLMVHVFAVTDASHLVAEIDGMARSLEPAAG